MRKVAIVPARLTADSARLICGFSPAPWPMPPGRTAFLLSGVKLGRKPKLTSHQQREALKAEDE
jgi:hypothetical protein